METKKYRFGFDLILENRENKSGKLLNFVKRFLRLAATTICNVSKRRDDNGIQYVRRFMINCGFRTS